MNICVVGVGMGMVARGQVFVVGNGSRKVNSTWVDVKGPDLHVCSCACVCVCVCVCVGVECWNMHSYWGL